MSEQGIGRAPQEVIDRWSECFDAAKTLPPYVCIRLARRRRRRGRPRRGERVGGTAGAVAASELYAIAFEGESILRSVEEELQTVLERLKAFDLAMRLMGDE